MKCIEVGIGVECQRGSLIEALCAHRALEFFPAALVFGQAAARNGRRLKEGGDNMVIAIFTDDFLREVRLTNLNILTVAGCNDFHRVAVLGQFNLEFKAAQDIQNVLGRHGDAENRIDAADMRREVLALTGSTGRAVKMGGGHLAAAQFLNQVQRAGHAQFGGVLADALLIVTGSIGVLAKAACGLADVVTGELGGLKEELGRSVLDFAVEAAHNAGQCNRLIAVTDDKVLVGQRELLAVQCRDALTVRGAADNNLAAFQRIHIECVHRLTDFQHDVVGDVHHVGDAAQAAQGKAAAHPAGGFPGGDVAHIVADIARAEVGRFHGNVQARVLIIACGVIGSGHFEGLIQHGSNLAGDAENALAVRTVGGDGDVKDVIVQSDHLLNGGAGDGIFGQVEQSVNLGAGIEVLIEAQFLAGAEHTVGLNAHQGFGLNFDAAGQCGAVKRGGGVHTRINVGCTGGNLNVMAVIAAVHLADVQVGALLRDALGDNTDNDFGNFGGEVNEFLDLETAVKQLLFQFLGGNVNIHILFEPAEWYFHLRSLLLVLELLQEAQIVLGHQADVVDAVLEHGNTLDADAESKAGIDLGVDVAVAQNLLMHHAGTQDLNPAGVLAQRAALAAAGKTGDVNLNAGLGEREIARAQTGPDAFTEQFLNELVEHTLKVAERDALIHNKTFHLMEHRGVGGIGVRAENAAGNQDLDGRLFHIHHTDLAAAGLGAQDNVICNVESILHIAGRMIFRNIQAGEVVVIVLNFGPFKNLKAHAGKNIDNLVFDQRDGMERAGFTMCARQRDVHSLGTVALCEFGRFNLIGKSLVLPFCPDFELVDGLAGGRALLFGHIAQRLGQASHAAILAQILLPECREFLFVVHSGAVGFQFRAQCRDFFFHNTPL